MAGYLGVFSTSSIILAWSRAHEWLRPFRPFRLIRPISRAFAALQPRLSHCGLSALDQIQLSKSHPALRSVTGRGPMARETFGPRILVMAAITTAFAIKRARRSKPEN